MKFSVILAAFELMKLSVHAEANATAHVIMVGDTLDEKIGVSVQGDLALMKKLLISTIPANRLSISQFSGKQATAKNLADAIQSLTVKPSDTILVYLSCHGVIVDNRHKVVMQDGLCNRQDILNLAQSKNPRLAILLSDCCSNIHKPASRDMKAIDVGGMERGVVENRIIRDLLFRHQGLVDITGAAKGTYGRCYGNKCGVFTGGLFLAITQNNHQIDSNQDGIVSWNEITPRVRTETSRLFHECAKQDPEILQEQQDQVPWVKSLPNTSVFDPLNPKVTKTDFGIRYGAITIKNTTEMDISYTVRWGKNATGKTFTVKAGQIYSNWIPLNADGTAPKPYIVFHKESSFVKEYSLDFFGRDGGFKFDEGYRYEFRKQSFGLDLIDPKK